MKPRTALSDEHIKSTSPRFGMRGFTLIELLALIVVAVSFYWHWWVGFITLGLFAGVIWFMFKSPLEFRHWQNLSPFTRKVLQSCGLKPQAQNEESTPPASSDQSAESSRQFFILRNDEKFGPYSTIQIRELIENKHFFPLDLAWHERLEKWTPLYKLPEFSEQSAAVAPASITSDSNSSLPSKSKNLPPEDKKKDFIDRNPWTWSFPVAGIGYMLAFTGFAEAEATEWGIAVLYFRIAGIVALAISPVIFFTGLPKKAEIESDTYDIESPQTSNSMDHRLLEELVKLNRKQHFWIRALGIVYIVLPILYGVLSLLRGLH